MPLSSKLFSGSVVSIDNWHELLDPPLVTGVVRACGNWIGRLAATSVSVASGHHIILFAGKACWACGREEMQRDQADLESAIAFLNQNMSNHNLKEGLNPRYVFIM